MTPVLLLGRRAGVLLGRSRTADVIDAALILLARDGDILLTSDPTDLELIAAAAGLQMEIAPVRDQGEGGCRATKGPDPCRPRRCPRPPGAPRISRVV